MSRPVVHPKVLDRLQESFLTDVIDIHSLTRVTDGQGGWISTYTITSTVQGRIYPWSPGNTGDEMLSADKTTLVVSHKAIVPLATVVTGEDRLSSASDFDVAFSDEQGLRTYRVVWIANKDQHKELTLLEIE